ncbi:MAG: DUF1800 domain-containing protein [Bacteroidota bacterium]
MPDKTMVPPQASAFALLNRVTYGPTPSLRADLEKLGWEAWVDQQLNPTEADPDLQAIVADFRYKLEIEVGKREVEREFPLELYPRDTAGLLALVKGMEEPPDHVFRRPSFETFLMTWLRMLHSQWQLQEILAEFWHNHFNVSIEAHDYIPLVFPVWDREVIRKHTFGNFRTFLEATAKSPCMLLYLDNAFSRSGPANENYARELFELHTLGAENYYNHLYDEWREVPGAGEGKAEGYIDEDVYEAARAFTGWTVGDGEEHDGGIRFPATGKFHYCDQWHDHYQKRVLGVEFRSHQGPERDGQRVLDLLAYHPGTARHLCQKLCRWLVADEPPAALVERATQVWQQNQKAPDQIAQVVRTILLSPEFTESGCEKVKRPNHLIASLARSLGPVIKPGQVLYWWLREMGYSYFSFSAPTGHPDHAGHWLNTDMLLKRWNTMPLVLFADEDEGGMLQGRLTDQCADTLDTPDKLIDFWSRRLLGKPAPERLHPGLKRVFAQEIEGATVPYLRKHHPDGFEFKVRQLVSLIALSPDFQTR